MIMKVEQPEIKNAAPMTGDRETASADLQNQTENRKNTPEDVAAATKPAIAAKTTEPTAEELQTAAAELDKKLATRKKTLGETLFNRGLYTGVGWGANEFFSMVFTGMFQRGENSILGKKRFNSWSDKLSKNFKGGKAQAQEFLMWASLNVVGSFVVPAIKIIDGYKQPLVKKLNHMFASSGMSEEQIAARDKEVEVAVASEAAQSWKTLIIGRIVAMAAAIGNGTFIMGRKEDVSPKEYSVTIKREGKPARKIDITLTPKKTPKPSGNEWIAGKFDWAASKLANATGSKRLAKMANETPNYFTPSTNGPIQPDQPNAFHYYAGLMGPETVGCAVTSVVLEGVSKYAAKKDPHIKNPEIRKKAIEEIILKNRVASHVEQIAGEKPGDRLVGV